MSEDIKWIIEPEFFQNEESFEVTLREMGIRFDVFGFGKPWNYIGGYLDRKNIVFHGSMQLNKFIEELVYIKGMFFNDSKLNCQYYYPRFGKHLLNSNYIMRPLGDILNRELELFRLFGGSDYLFIRPASPRKIFRGQIVDFSRFTEKVAEQTRRCDPENLFLISPVVDIVNEWRMVVVNNKVITGSQYNKNKKQVRLPADQRITDYVNEVLSQIDYKPDPIWVIDVCETSNGKLKVLEVGPFSCSAMYACDKKTIVKAVNQIVLGGN